MHMKTTRSAAKAILGALLDQLQQSSLTEQLYKSLNLITKYKLEGMGKALSTIENGTSIYYYSGILCKMFLSHFGVLIPNPVYEYFILSLSIENPSIPLHP